MNTLLKRPKLVTALQSISETTSLKFTHYQPKASLTDIFDWPKTSLISLPLLLFSHPMIMAIIPHMIRD